MDRLKVIFIAIAVILGGLFVWFSSNFFYTLFWAFMEKWDYKEASVIAYTLAHLAPFVLMVAVVLVAYFVVRHEINKSVARTDGAAVQESIQINVGEEGPFERLLQKPTSIWRLERMLLLEFKNPFPDKEITGCKIEIVTIEPFAGARRPLVLVDNFTLAGGDHRFIPFATYGESRSVDRNPVADTAIAICAPEGQDPNFLAALPHDVENIITVRATAVGARFCEEKLVVWVGAGTRLRIRKCEGPNEDVFIPLEQAAKEAYGAARNTAVGSAAEKMNTNGVLAWFAYYYHTQEIPVYGNVRNSSRVEPVLFRHVDIKMENERIIGKEIYGDLIWENLQVRKSDQALMLRKLRDHSRALSKPE